MSDGLGAGPVVGHRVLAGAVVLEVLPGGEGGLDVGPVDRGQRHVDGRVGALAPGRPATTKRRVGSVAER